MLITTQMATLSPFTTNTTANNHISATPFILKKPFFARTRPSKISTTQYRSQRFAPSKLVSCKATENRNNNDPKNPQSNEIAKKTSNNILDRRNMLLGLGSLYGAATTLTLGGSTLSSVAAPLTPDVRQCVLTNNVDTVTGEIPGKSGEACCLNFPATGVKDFRFQDYPVTTMKIRREAHSASNDDAYMKDYKRALHIMKCFPADDPRSFEMQRLIHCAYCDGAYRQLGFPDRNFRIHYSWLFASFHRWYLYFFERILGKLINKPDFALPYWSWDNSNSMTIPPMFLDVNSPLYNDSREKIHINRVVDLDFAAKFDDPNAENITDDQLIEQNLKIMRDSMNEKNREIFFGGAYKAGDARASPITPVVNPGDNNGGGTLESALHNGVHAWVNGDMGYYSTGGRDPLFYAHHANIDRMWSVWKSLGEGRSDLDDPDYLGTSFVLWDENAQPVRVYVRDCLDNKKLGYNFECNYLPWRDAFPTDCENGGGGGGGGGGPDGGNGGGGNGGNGGGGEWVHGGNNGGKGGEGWVQSGNGGGGGGVNNGPVQAPTNKGNGGRVEVQGGSGGDGGAGGGNGGGGGGEWVHGGNNGGKGGVGWVQSGNGGGGGGIDGPVQAPTSKGKGGGVGWVQSGNGGGGGGIDGPVQAPTSKGKGGGVGWVQSGIGGGGGGIDGPVQAPTSKGKGGRVELHR